jgi:hypothetical protein
VAALAMVGCTLSSHGNRADPLGPSGPEAIALLPYAQQFAAIIAPLDVARHAFESGSGALPTGASVGDFELVARPLADAVATADAEIRQVAWPALARRDIKSELAADKSLTAELLGTLDDTLVVSVWRRQIISAANRASRAGRLVGRDLGLPSPSE